MKAAVDGEVVAVLHQQGDTVAKDAPLVKLKPLHQEEEEESTDEE